MPYQDNGSTTPTVTSATGAEADSCEDAHGASAAHADTHDDPSPTYATGWAPSGRPCAPETPTPDQP